MRVEVGVSAVKHKETAAEFNSYFGNKNEKRRRMNASRGSSHKIFISLSAF